MLKKSTFREIKSSLGRYLAILAIVALGVGFFSGLKVTQEAMVKTTDVYLEEQNLFDYRLVSTLGFEDVDIEKLSQAPEVKSAQPSVSTDALYHFSGDDVDKVLKFHSITDDVNSLCLMSGRMPESSDECVIDYQFGDDVVGKSLVLSDRNDKDTLDLFKKKKLKIVGTVVSPIYLNFERGTTSLGNGTVSGFAYLNLNSFDTDYYTEVYIDLKKDYMIYSDEYKDYIDSTEDFIEETLTTVGTDRHKRIVDEAMDEWKDAKKEYDDGLAEYKEERAEAYAELEDARIEIEEGKSEISKAKKELDDNEATLKKNKKDLEAALEQVNQGIAGAEAYGQPTDQLQAQKQGIQANLAEVNEGLNDIEAGRSELAERKKDLDDGEAEYWDGLAEADREFAKAKEELDEAKDELDEALQDIKDIEEAETFVLDRNTNVGYACFESDSEIVDGIAKVFPLFFFLVAALVCMTTMTRMVDEQRTQIGVLKALGYSNLSVMGKYLFYSGSAAFVGAVIGFFAGSYIFPMVIWKCYGMMYDFNSHILYVINWKLGLATLLAALLCSMGSTLISVIGEFRDVPAQIIRPKAPKNGKRILLERVSFIWSRLGFLQKVSLRNVFRYKKRFLMMILGISGCTALLVAGFGIRDSIQNIVNYQFDEIQTFDYSITFDKNMDDRRQDRFIRKTSSNFDEIIFLSQSSGELIINDKVKSVSIIAADGDNDTFERFVDLHDKAYEHIEYPKEGEAVICKKLSRNYDISIGDTITLRDQDMHEMTVTVSGICENFIYNYIYMTPSTYEKGFGSKPDVKTAFVRCFSTADSENLPEDTEGYIQKSAAKVLDNNRVAAVSVNNDMRDRINNMMKSLNYIVILVIVSAGMLAFIVLYNLTNINITERIREIATIKVLGFRSRETSSYVFRENVLLTAVSALVGLVVGRLLLEFIILQINVDMISFDVRITVMSYIMSVIMTFVFAFIVNLVMKRKLDNISMTESLKSIE